MSASFRAAIGGRFGHGQTCFKGCTIFALLRGGLLRDNYYPVVVRMVTVRAAVRRVVVHRATRAEQQGQAEQGR